MVFNRIGGQTVLGRAREILLFGSAIALTATSPAWAGGKTERVSVGVGGVQANGGSSGGALSEDGRFVVFDSEATNLVRGDTNRLFDVFVRDRKIGETERLSVGSGGAEGNDNSFLEAISGNGRFVAFTSDATNLVSGDTNGTRDVFIRDRTMSTTERVSVGPGGVEGNAFSGRGVAISAGGRFVAFISAATNLVPGDTNGSFDVFVHDRQMGTTERASVGPGGVQGNMVSRNPAISADGRFVAFTSDASNLVPGDTNGQSDVFVRVFTR